MRGVWRAMVLSASLALAACDPLHLVRSDIPSSSTAIDPHCVQSAIEATRGLHFDRQAESAATGRCISGDCDEKSYQVFYSVLANHRYRAAVVQLHVHLSGKVSVDNASLGIFQSLPEDDREGFRLAMTALNQQITKAFPGAGTPTAPEYQ
jgi:hypothetical protein